MFNSLEHPSLGLLTLCIFTSQAVWIVVPLSYGILVRHESANKKKIAGAVLCMVAAVVLGLAGD